MRAGSWRKQNTEELMLSSCGAGEDSSESLGQQGDKPVNLKGNQPWILIGRTDTEAEAPIHWPPDAKSRLTGKDSDAGKDWRQKEKRVTEDEMVGWHHWLNRHELGQILGDGEGQGSLACCSPWRVRHDLATEQWQRFARIWNIQLLLLETFWIFFFPEYFQSTFG